jgi:transposase InsO family protein
MARLGLEGVVRGKAVKTTVSDKAAACPLDLVSRQFHAPAPNMLWFSDFTYVSTWSGMVYVAFVIDVFVRCIVGWRVSHDQTAAGSFSTPWSRPCTLADRPRTSSTTATETRNMSASATRSGWRRPASILPSAQSATATATRSPGASSGSSKQRSSTGSVPGSPSRQ